jgi:ribose 5-phosphate isomerase B
LECGGKERQRRAAAFFSSFYFAAEVRFAAYSRLMYHPNSSLTPTSKESFNMKIALASDHAGFEEKEKLKLLLRELGIEFEDLGTASDDSVDYPDYAVRVARKVANNEADQGLLVCGSGTGMAIAANKVPGVRAALAWSEETARLARQHNDANVLTVGARTTAAEEIPKIVKAFFSTPFDGGRHAGRVAKINQLDYQNSSFRN